MPIPDDRLQELIVNKDPEAAQASCKKHGYDEFWHIIDGALVIFDGKNPPDWLPKDEDRDDDGNTAAFVDAQNLSH